MGLPAVEQTTEKKVDVSKRLEKEVGELANLRDCLERSSQVATNVGNILDSFEHRLARLETTILPVYQQTGNLQRRQQNTEKTLQALDYVINFYNVAGQVEGIVREHPGSVGVPRYLEAMDRLAAACQYFEANNPQSVELENVTTLFDMGTKHLRTEFRDELKKYQKPVPPVTTLELVSLEEHELNDDILMGIELVPPGVRADLRAIAEWLDQHSDSDRPTVYAKLRSDALSQSLQALRDYQRSGSAERPGVSTPGAITSSPGPFRARIAKVDTTPRSRSHKISNLLESKANRMLQKAMAGHLLTMRRQGTPVTAGEEGLEDADVLIYLTQVTALHRLAYAELQLAQQLVPADCVTRTFELILLGPMDQLVAEGENLASQARRSVGRGDLQAVLSILALVKHMTSMQPEYDGLLTNCQTSIRAKFSAIINTLHETTLKALDGFVESIKSDSDRALPKDGTVHEVTSNALIFVEQLLDYAVTLAPILQRETSVSGAIGSFFGSGGRDQAKALLGGYIKRVLANLGSSLVHRSESYSDPTLRALFRLNNYNYILKTLHSSDLLTYVSVIEPECDKMYNENILEQKRIYSQSWSRVLHYICGVEDVPYSVIQAGKLRDKEKQLIKDKFAGFNREIEEMQKVQRGYSIPDRELRESLKRDNKEYILPKYQAFYDKYVCIPFTKNTEKYIRYSPAEVSSKVDEFFDVAA